MRDAYHPDTLEHIPTDTPADWMLRAGVAAPAYNPATDGCFFRAGAWVIVSALIQINADAKVSQWAAIKVKRDAVKLGGLKVGTKWYHTDETSRTQYIGLLRLADAAVAAGGVGTTVLQYSAQDIQWKTMDGTFIKMTVQRANDVFAAVTGLDFAAFAAAETHKAAMEAAADPVAYNFSAGWPASFPVV